MTDEKFTPFYPINKDGSVKLCTSLLIYKEVKPNISEDTRTLIKAELIRYKHDTQKFSYEERIKQEIEGLESIFYIDFNHGNILNEQLKEVAKTTLIRSS
ncbi:hypothetical protein E0H80_16285 [Acinetobacter sp. ANC 4779]|uniref:hypothetical protein n=1 Tax=Acinetobacter sp. ANC 4779 TaxID=2529848 RepID=UPI00103A4BD3|nr:hypothetical protein [Acinetobacter sp. ANC 4779]TCB47352.1 hypothetical protein E0H80_16285 [Acinetobacter sp. ANC 4779]